MFVVWNKNIIIGTGVIILVVYIILRGSREIFGIVVGFNDLDVFIYRCFKMVLVLNEFNYSLLGKDRIRWW